MKEKAPTSRGLFVEECLPHFVEGWNKFQCLNNFIALRIANKRLLCDRLSGNGPSWL